MKNNFGEKENMKRGVFFRVLTLFLAVIILTTYVGLVLSAPGDEATFTATELLGRITDSSVTVNVVAEETLEVYFQFGTQPGVYTGQTSTSTFPGNTPIEMVIGGLQSDTRYYYRMVYRQGTSDWIARDEHSFHTQRAPGSTFTFTIIADSHLDMGCNPTLYDQTLENVLADNPDFHIDLGDTFKMDYVTSWSQTQSAYLAQRPHMGIISHSTPIFIINGNHENEEGWNLDDSPFSQAIASINGRKMYYPTPITDGFYTGNTDDSLTAIDGDHLREDYYAWEWGDMLFVVLDPFQYTMDLPYFPTAGEGSDDSVTGDQWSWTLGKQQYDWFKNTLENSNAKFKFVFSHHVTGGQLSVGGGAGGPGYVRGGANAAPYFEWGGRNADGTWGFETERSGWGNVSIHQLMIDNGVNAFFHGHDHQYAYEKRDGIVYQEVPQPGSTGNGFGLYSESDPYTIKVLPSSGHLRVTVSPSEVTVDYVRSYLSGGTNGEVAYTYTIMPNSINETPVAHDQAVSTGKNTPKDITLYASDAEGDDLSYQIVTQPSHGTLSGTGRYGTYTPDSGYSGLDSFTFKVTDGWTESNIATVSITVMG
jgi:hypothetical protein